MSELDEQFFWGDEQGAVDQALEVMRRDQIVKRIWEKDYTVWSDSPEEIVNRLGWLDIAGRTLASQGELIGLRDALKAEGYTCVLLLGMGGSSLAPDVFSRVFGPVEDGLELEVLDSTDADAVKEAAAHVVYGSTLFVVATKSGGTAETLSFFKYFYNNTVSALGEEKAGRQFVAITDSGSKLDKLAETLSFRKTFRNDPNIGGRYSALSYFGMVAAALIGMDLERYLKQASRMAEQCRSEADNPGARLGTVMGVLANQGRDKLTFIPSPTLRPFADWLEQLLAESTGKQGKGILPVAGEAVGKPKDYGSDRLFAYLRLDGEDDYDEAVGALIAAGQPVVRYDLGDRYDLAGQMFLWEFATAVAGYHLQINAFNQPNVEAAKEAARQMIKAYTDTGKLPEVEAAIIDGTMRVIGSTSAKTPKAALRDFLAQGQPGDYVALQAYIQMSPDNEKVLHKMQQSIRDNTGLATTLGFGPRFLHSTGQFHKGGPNTGLFVQIVSHNPEDVDIPDEPGSDASAMPFGVLKNAQVLGDRQALLDAGRRVITFDVDNDVEGGLKQLSNAI